MVNDSDQETRMPMNEKTGTKTNVIYQKSLAVPVLSVTLFNNQQ